MSAPNRAAKFNKLHRVAKKHYPVVKPPAGRSVLEHLLYACCLQNSNFEDADEALAQIQRNYFDWNEVRVTTVNELAKVMSCLSEPMPAAMRLKKTLNWVFETYYAFDIDFMRKENLGKAVQKLNKGRWITPFVVSYVAQNGLGGHQIAADEAMIDLMYIIGAIDEKEKEAGKITGLERSIPKTKGVDFFSTVHQLAVAFRNQPFKPDLRKLLTGIDSGAKDRFPKRGSKKKVAEKKPAKAKKATAKASAKSAGKVAAKSSAKTSAKAAAKTGTKKKSKTTKKTATTRKKKVQAKSTKSSKSAKRSTAKSPTKRLKKKKPR